MENIKKYDKFINEDESYEDIDWSDFDYEEDEPKPLNKNDAVKVDGYLIFWNPNGKFFNNTEFSSYIGYIEDIKKSEDIYRDGDNILDKGKIPYDGWLIMLEGHWPWFIYNDKVIKKIK